MDQDFKRHADDALEALYRMLLSASDDYGFRVRFEAGAIRLQFSRRPAKLVISPHTSAGQVWVSVRSKSYRLDWDVVENAFVLASTGQTLKELVEEAISEHLGEEVSL